MPSIETVLDYKVKTIVSFESNPKARAVMDANHKNDFNLVHGWKGKHNVEDLNMSDIKDLFNAYGYFDLVLGW